jgi:hypothetical protein
VIDLVVGVLRDEKIFLRPKLLKLSSLFIMLFNKFTVDFIIEFAHICDDNS